MACHNTNQSFKASKFIQNKRNRKLTEGYKAQQINLRNWPNRPFLYEPETPFAFFEFMQSPKVLP